MNKPCPRCSQFPCICRKHKEWVDDTIRKDEEWLRQLYIEIGKEGKRLGNVRRFLGLTDDLTKLEEADS
jgi:hypothetical protein